MTEFKEHLEDLLRILRENPEGAAMVLRELLKLLIEREQEPEGHRKERVAEWLREKGYTVT